MLGRRVLVTGAAGFVGRATCTQLRKHGYTVTAAVRRSAMMDMITLPVGDVGPNTNWSAALNGVEAVVHLAARAHLLTNQDSDPLAEFRRVNTDGTLALARQAVCAGVRRFIFISSIGVNGAETYGEPFTATSPVQPHSPYAVSKYEAELKLRELAGLSGLEVVIIRPPLVVGPGAPGNFRRLLGLVYKAIPLPFARIHNRRSLVGLDNLVDLIRVCLEHPQAKDQTFLVSDDEDISTTDLLRRLARELGKPARLVPVPASLLRWSARMLGEEELAQRLIGSLQVDIAKTRQALGWSPPATLSEALRQAAIQYRNCDARSMPG